MRFLCLHGAGTNAEIFEIQLGGVTAELAKKGHSFKFINGQIEAEPQAEFKNVLDGPFYNHYTRGPEVPGEMLSQAFAYTQRIIHEEGPFEGVIGFSQGASLACSMLARVRKEEGSDEPLFKCAVFVCAAAPFEVGGLGFLRNSDSDGKKVVDVPTAHILGKQDELFGQGMQLYGLCEPGKAVVYDHGLGHKVPFDWERTGRIVRVIEEVIGTV